VKHSVLGPSKPLGIHACNSSLQQRGSSLYGVCNAGKHAACAASIVCATQASVIELTEFAAGALGDQLLHMHLPRAGPTAAASTSARAPAAMLGPDSCSSTRAGVAAAAAAAAGHGSQKALDPCSMPQALQQQQQQQQTDLQQQQQQWQGQQMLGGWTSTAAWSESLQLCARDALRQARHRGQLVLGGGWPGHTRPAQLQGITETVPPPLPPPQLQQLGIQHKGQLQQEQPGRDAQPLRQPQQARACAGGALVAPAPDVAPGSLVEPLSVGVEALALADAQAVVGGAQVSMQALMQVNGRSHR